MKKFKLKIFWPLLLLLFAVLFPVEWVGTFWPEFNELLTGVFSSARAHAVGHAAIFGMLGLFLLFYFPTLRTRPLFYFSLILIGAIGQEGFQLMFKRRALEYDDFRDIAVDMVAASVIFGLVWFWSQFFKRRNLARR